MKRNYISQSNDRFIAILLAGESLSMTELGRKTGIPESSLKRLVDRLESADYVRRDDAGCVRLQSKGEIEVAGGIREMRRLGAFSDVPSTAEYRRMRRRSPSK